MYVIEVSGLVLYMWRSVGCDCWSIQIAQLVEHLTGVSEGPGLKPSLIHCNFLLSCNLLLYIWGFIYLSMNFFSQSTCSFCDHLCIIPTPLFNLSSAETSLEVKYVIDPNLCLMGHWLWFLGLNLDDSQTCHLFNFKAYEFWESNNIFCSLSQHV